MVSSSAGFWDLSIFGQVGRDLDPLLEMSAAFAAIFSQNDENFWYHARATGPLKDGRF